MTRNIKPDNASQAEGLVVVYAAVTPPSDAAKAAGRRAAQLSASAIVIS
jgi:hypothetical protein